MSEQTEGAKLQPIPSHPPPGASFQEWFRDFSSIIALINPAELFSPQYRRVSFGIHALKLECEYELTSPADRTKSSVYDRSDYIVRELLRTSRLVFLQQFCRQLASQLMQGTLVIDDKGVLLKEGKVTDPFHATILLVELPSLFALCFTAQETIGTISMDEVLRFVAEILNYAVDHKLSYAYPISLPQYDIFSCALFIINKSLEYMKVLNTTLFFGLFDDLDLFTLIVKIIIKSYQEKASKVFDHSISCISSFIQSTQTETYRKKMSANKDFVTLYKSMMTAVVDPLLKDNRDNRSKFRSILFYNRSLKE